MSDPLGRLLAEHGATATAPHNASDPLDALLAAHGSASTSDGIALPDIPRAQSEGTYRGPPRENPHATRLTGPARILTQYVAQPMVDNPLSTVVSTAVPPIALLGAMAMGKDVAQYAGQKAAELTLPAHERALAEANPDRIPGERAAVEAGMLLAPMVIGKAAKAVGARLGDVSEGVTEAGAQGVKEQVAEQAPLWGPNRRPEYSLPIEQRLPREPGPGVEPVSAGGTPLDALDQLISTRLYLNARGRLDDVGPVGRRPAGTLPMEQRLPVEPPPDAATYSTKSTGVLRRPGGQATPSEAPTTVIGRLTDDQAAAINVAHQAIRNAPASEIHVTPEAAAHIWENPARRAQMESLGYTSAEHFLTDVGSGITHIYDSGPNSVALVKQLADGRVIWANLAGDEPPRWQVGSAASVRDGTFKNKTQLWPPAPEGGPNPTRVEHSLPAADLGAEPRQGSGGAGAERLTEPQSRPESIRPGTPEGNARLETQSFGGPTPGALEPVATADAVRPDVKRLVNRQLGPEPLSTPVAPPEPPASPEPSASDLLNVTKLDLGSKTAEQRVAQQLEQFRQLRESNKQTFAEADVNRREIMNELLANDPKALSPMAAKRLSGEELLARRDVVRQNDAVIDDLSKQIESRTLSVDDHAQAVEMLNKAVAQNDALLSDLVTGSSQKGRDLNLLRRMANRSLDPDVWLVQAKRMLGDKPLTDEIAAGIRKLAQEAVEACGGA